MTNKVHDLFHEMKRNNPQFSSILWDLIPGAFIVFLATEEMEQYEIACCLSMRLDFRQGDYNAI